MSHKKEDKEFFTNISKHLNIKSNVYKFGDTEFDQVYSKVMNKLDEPFVDASVFPTYYVSKQAAKKVKVVLSGEGGDEYFYGYARHKTLYSLRNKADYKMTWLDNLYFGLPKFKQKNYLFKILFRLNQQPLSFYLASKSIGKDLVFWAKCKKEMEKQQLKPLEIDKKLYLENVLLRKIDLATSYNSIEGRVPLLDIDFIQSSDNFEDKKLEEGQLKAPLKEILCSYLPKNLVYRGKSGFGVDMRHQFKRSAQLKEDYAKAVEYLKKRDLLPRKFKKSNPEWYLSRVPNFCFSIIVLYYTLKYHK